MTLAIIINAVLCSAVIFAVVAPLVWAIVTQHRHETVVVATRRGTRQVPAKASRQRRRGLYEPIIWPAGR
ncbi:MAG TPA: hypothetical protein VGF93_19610 [Solirubrobacteraceae bacterium]|jgi:hypothetical protein